MKLNYNKDLSRWAQIIKLLEENPGVKLHDSGYGKDFLWYHGTGNKSKNQTKQKLQTFMHTRVKNRV